MQENLGDTMQSKRDQFNIELRKEKNQERIEASRARINPGVFENIPTSNEIKKNTNYSKEDYSKEFQTLRNEYQKCENNDVESFIKITQKVRLIISKNEDPDNLPLQEFAQSDL